MKLRAKNSEPKDENAEGAEGEEIAEPKDEEKPKEDEDEIEREDAGKGDVRPKTAEDIITVKLDGDSDDDF